MMRGRRDHGPPKGGLIRKGVQAVSGGVGLASESIKAHKESKAVKPENQEHASTPYPNSDGKDNPEAKDNPDRDIEASENPPLYEGIVEDTGHELETEWNLDDAQDDIIEDPEKRPVGESGELEDVFLRNHPPPEYVKDAPTGKLSLPVVLPQRRPKDRSRGFIRAYAPVLENCGIDQATWLAFLDTFQKSSAANPWLNAINLAAIGTMFMPHVIGLVVGYAIGQATDIAIELQARQRTSDFLYKTNQEFFRPRGLYCLVMTWNPESTRQIEQVNLTSTIATHSNPATGIGGLQNKYKTSDGNTYGEWEFPEVAPLVFPALDQLAAQTSEDGVQKKTKMGKGLTFVANYWDKRATAEYAMKNPGSVLANVPQEKFNSRYADPNHLAASGSLISFVSGGHLVPNPESRGLLGGIVSVVGQAVRGERQGSGWDKVKGTNGQGSNQPYNDLQYANQYSRNYRGMGRRGQRNNDNRRDGLISTPVNVYKKLLKKNVLYLMVVNMPSDEEMAAAKAAVQH